MANKNLFNSITSRFRRADTVNEAGGAAYKLTAKHALAQLAATGCFNGTFYAQGQDQLTQLIALIEQVDDSKFLAQLAVYSREQAMMKDMPAALLVALTKRDPQWMQRVFHRVVDNGRMLRTVFQMIRSGQFGRRSLSSSLQRAFQRWLNEASVGKLLSASIGNNPSLRDVLRLARPTPKDNARRALFGWLTNKPVEQWLPATEADLPAEVRLLTAFRQAETAETQVALMDQLHARWDLLADAARGPAVWQAIARHMGPQALRMNLNTLLRHEVFGATGRNELAAEVAQRLSDAEEIRRSRQFPYQFLAAYLNADAAVPQVIKGALHQAAEVACENVPELAGPVVIGLDVSGSMGSAVTGNRGRGATSKMRCVDVAALFAAAILRRNPSSVLVPFDDRTHQADVDPQDAILSLSARLARYGGGGTNCSLPLAEANRRKNVALAGCVLVSDNQSWIGKGSYGSTGVLTEWEKFVQNQRRLGVYPNPKLVCIDLQPYLNTQAPERADILNIGGFSDAVFQVVSAFLRNDSARFVAEVEAVEV